MIRQPPRSTRTDKLLPCTTLFRSFAAEERCAEILARKAEGCSCVRLPVALGFKAVMFLYLSSQWSVISAGWRCELKRSEEHTSELQSLMRLSYAVFCLKKKIKDTLNQLCLSLTT